MDMDDYGEIPATPGGGETPVRDEQDEEYNPEIQESEDREMYPDLPVEENEYNPETAGNMEESDVEEHERMDGDYENQGSPRSGHSSPAYSHPGSPVESNGPHSPAGPTSPVGSEPHSPFGDEPRSPSGSMPQSPAGSEPRSPRGSYLGSPIGSGPLSPAGSGPHSPAGSEPRSPRGSYLGSPIGSGPRSPAGSGPLSPAGSGPLSPAGSGPRSPAGSGPLSPAGSGPRSPAGSGGQASPARSRASRSRSRSPEPGARSRSGSPRSPARSNASSPRSGSPGSRHSSPVVKRNSQRAVDFDSEGEDVISTAKSKRKRQRIKGSDEEEEDGEERRALPSDSEDEERTVKKRKRKISREGSDEEKDFDQGDMSKILPSDSEDELPGTPRSGKRKGGESDNEDSDKGSNVGGLINDIFGKSDSEEEFEGFGESDVTSYAKKDKKQSGFASDEDEGTSKPKKILPELSSDEEGGDGDRKNRREDFVSDFDLMMEKKKAEMARRRRKRKDVDILNDSDEIIEDMIKKMKEAVESDRELNKQKKPAIKVLCFLPIVKRNLMKVELHNAMIDGGILPAITEWLAPLPDKSLPHLEVREALLRQLLEFSQISTEGLRMSGLGKAVMFLFKHPRETRANKEIANRLINDWARPIFNQNADYKSLSREDREQRDLEQMPKRRRLSMEGGTTPHRDIGKAMAGEEKVLRPGDPGYIYRARVPQPSNKDYVVRPKWNVEDKPTKGSGKKAGTKLDKMMRQGKRSKQTFQSAVKISIEGRNMAL